MTNLSSAYPFIIPDASQCPNITVLFHMQEAALEFFQKTLAWRQTLPVVPSRVGALSLAAPVSAATSGTLSAPFTGPTRNDYTVIFSDGTPQFAVTLTNGSTAIAWTFPVTSDVTISYLVSNYPLPLPTGTSLAKLLSYHIDGREATVINPDRGERIQVHQSSGDVAWTDDRTTVNVSPSPRVANTQYTFTCALKPLRSATTIPDQFFEDYGRIIAIGALSEVLNIQKQPWTNPKKAQEKRIEFEQRTHSVALQVAKGFARSRSRVRAHMF